MSLSSLLLGSAGGGGGAVILVAFLLIAVKERKRHCIGDRGREFLYTESNMKRGESRD